MIANLIWNMLNRLGILVMLIYCLSKLRIFSRIMTRKEVSWRAEVIMILIFGTIGIMGNYFSTTYSGALVNTRVIGVASGGMYGGPVVGLGAAAVAVLHRLSLGVGDFTLKACSISTLIEGLIAGYAHYVVRNKPQRWLYGALIGVICESLRKISVLVFSRPFEQAVEVVKVIWLPMTLVNSIGLALFVAMIDSILGEHEKAKAFQAKLSLSIAGKTLPILRRGLTSETARETAEIISSMADYDAVAITDSEKILCHIGAGRDHHKEGAPILTHLTRQVLEGHPSMVGQSRTEIGCNHKDCPLQAAVVVPLKIGSQVVGTLKMYRCRENSMGETDLELALGLAHLFSSQLELSMLEEQSKILTRTQMRVLQAQINPHFLFNSLNTISVLCRLDPDRAREVIQHLANYYRKNLKKGDELIDLWEEIDHVKSYVEIEKARFKAKLSVRFEVFCDVPVKIPPLTVQPLVENAINHGVLPKDAPGEVRVIVKNTGERVFIIVKDDGVGMSKDVLKRLTSMDFPRERFGLESVIKRLQYIYGPEFSFRIISRPGWGTAVVLKLPAACAEERAWENAASSSSGGR